MRISLHSAVERPVLAELQTSLRTILQNVLMNQIGASMLVSGRLRQLIYCVCGARVRTRWIAPRCFFGGANISVGQGTFINYDCFLDTFAAITIGTNCNLAMQVALVTSTHVLGPQTKRGEALEGKPISIGDGCWLGARVMVLPGVQIAEGCVIAAGALVTGDCAANGLYAGVPARRIKELT